MEWSRKLTRQQKSILRAAALAASLAALCGQAGAERIYTCTDARGRRLTADRPIIECIDREQTEFSPGGLARRKILPAPTASERAVEEEKTRLREEEANRLAEEKRRDKALMIRYPNLAIHDKEREAVLARVDAVTAAAHRRVEALLAQRKSLEGELEFYRADPARTPQRLKRQVDETEAQLAAQKRFVAEQDMEKARVNARFGDELSRLKLLWAQQSSSPPASSSAAR
jgi:hypothetical protein